MAALSANIDVARKDGQEIVFSKTANLVIYKGAPVTLDASAGTAQSNDGTTTTLANGDIFVGFASEKSAATDTTVRVITSGTLVVPFTSIAQSDVGKVVYINNTTDDSLFTQTAVTADPQVKVGILVERISATSGRILIDNQIGQLAATTAP